MNNSAPKMGGRACDLMLMAREVRDGGRGRRGPSVGTRAMGPHGTHRCSDVGGISL